MLEASQVVGTPEHFIAGVRRGPGVICASDQDGWKQYPFQSTQEAMRLVTGLKSKHDIYATMGTLREGETERKRKSIESLSGFFLDLDCHGNEGEYVDFQDASGALRAFCRDLELPKPTYLVSSGHGLHAHWTLDESIPRNEWERAAAKLKRLTEAYGLKTDRRVTADSARVLRVPGTSNFRDPSAPVAVKMSPIPNSTAPSLEAFERALDQALEKTTEQNCKPSAPKPTVGLADRLQTASCLADLEDALSYLSSDVPRGNGSIIGAEGQPEADYWFGCLLAARREYGDAAKEIMRKWSQQSNRYEKAGFEHAWSQYDPNHANPVTIRSLFMLARSMGWPGSNPNPFLPATLADDSARFRLLDRSAIMAQAPLRWRLKGVFPEAGIGAIYGPSGSGKSFLGLDLGISVAQGESWFGHRASLCPVTYIMLEGEAGLRNRVSAWEAHNGKQIPDNFTAMAQPFELAQSDQIEELGAVIPDSGVVIIDTLNRAAPGLDENSSQDMGRVLAGMKRLQEITGGLVLIVHHTGKDASKGLRGHSSLFAALDGAIEVERSSNSRCWSAAKVKDGEDGKQVLFKLNVIDLGKDSDGDTVTSCAVSEDTGAIFQAKPPSGKHQNVALSAIRRALGASSSTGQGGAPSGSACLRFEEAVTQSAPELVGVEKKRRAARAREAVQGLISSGHLHRGLDDNEEEWVWL